MMSCPGPWAQVLTVSFFLGPRFFEKAHFPFSAASKEQINVVLPDDLPPSSATPWTSMRIIQWAIRVFFPRWNNRNRDQSKKGATLEDMWSNIWIRYHVFTCIRYRIIFVMKRAILACIYIIVRSRDFPVQCGNHGLHPVLCAKGGEWIGFF